MRQNKIIALFLLLVLCIQGLPLKQTISWLLRNQITEEVLHGNDGGKAPRFADDLQKQFLPSFFQPAMKLPASPLTGLGILSETLKGRHADDILTPPPNC